MTHSLQSRLSVHVGVRCHLLHQIVIGTVLVGEPGQVRQLREQVALLARFLVDRDQQRLVGVHALYIIADGHILAD